VSWATSGVETHELGPLERGDEVQGVPDRGQEEVAARLVGLRLEREAEPVLLCLGVLHQRVDGLPVAVERVPGILGHTGLGALAAAPADTHLGPQLRAQVDGAHRLADRRAPHSAVVGGERPVLERRMPEEIRRSHTDAHVRFLEGGLEAGHDTVALRGGDAPGNGILVVEAHAPCAELAEPPHGIGGVERRARRGAEGSRPGLPTVHNPKVNRCPPPGACPSSVAGCTTIATTASSFVGTCGRRSARVRSAGRVDASFSSPRARRCGRRRRSSGWPARARCPWWSSPSAAP